MSSANRDALIASALRIGANPLDYATGISYETGGTFSPSIRGGASNRHIGLIQFGPAEQKQFGASQSQTFEEQLPAVEAYLTTRGFKPGMGMLDLYSTINAGRPGLYNASDAGNGGAPGTVRDKVEQQMEAHRAKAAAFLGGDFKTAMPAAPTGNGRFGFSGIEAVPSPEPTAAPAKDDGPDLSALLKGLLASGASLGAAPQAAPQSLAPPVPRSPVPFDAQRFNALLGAR